MGRRIPSDASGRKDTEHLSHSEPNSWDGWLYAHRDLDRYRHHRCLGGHRYPAAQHIPHSRLQQSRCIRSQERRNRPGSVPCGQHPVQPISDDPLKPAIQLLSIPGCGIHDCLCGRFGLQHGGLPSLGRCDVHGLRSRGHDRSLSLSGHKKPSIGLNTRLAAPPRGKEESWEGVGHWQESSGILKGNSGIM